MLEEGARGRKDAPRGLGEESMKEEIGGQKNCLPQNMS